jgi:hypothetical protein
MITRIRPYPPSFSRTAARIMEPATGASTWALGSHKCTENKGSFTKKANRSINTPRREFRLTGKLIHGYHMIKWLEV